MHRCIGDIHASGRRFAGGQCAAASAVGVVCRAVRHRRCAIIFTPLQCGCADASGSSALSLSAACPFLVESGSSHVFTAVLSPATADGGLYLATPVDPVFVLLPILEAAAAQVRSTSADCHTFGRWSPKITLCQCVPSVEMPRRHHTVSLLHFRLQRKCFRASRPSRAAGRTRQASRRCSICKIGPVSKMLWQAHKLHCFALCL